MELLYSCEMCGYCGSTSSLTNDERRREACPRCGSYHGFVAEPDDVGYMDDERDVLGAGQSQGVSAWSAFAGAVS